MSNKKVEERHVLQKAVGDQSERGRDDPEHSGRQGRPQDPERILEVLREITDHGPRQASNHAEEHPPEGHFFFPSPSEQTDRNDHSGRSYDNGKDERATGGHAAIDRSQGLASIRTGNYKSGIDENLKHSMHNQELGKRRDTGLVALALRVGGCATTQGLVGKRENKRNPDTTLPFPRTENENMSPREGRASLEDYPGQRHTTMPAANFFFEPSRVQRTDVRE